MKQILAIIFLLSSKLIFSQTVTTIDYSYKQISTTTCNVFDTFPIIDGYVHKTSYGRPRFGDFSVILENGPSSDVTKTLATQFYIPYNFKAGYKYKFAFYHRTTFDQSGNGVVPEIAFDITNSPGTAVTATNCGAAEVLRTVNAPSINAANIGAVSFPKTSTF